MENKIVNCNGIEISNKNKICLIAGPCQLETEQHALDMAGKIKERHRHRYEVNVNLRKKFESHGLNFSGMSPDNNLPEIIEIKNHPWFIGVQFHPEFKSRPLKPHPLFSSFIKAAKSFNGK